jgi:16S rRNA (guanine966-N2)-methyltransferase
MRVIAGENGGRRLVAPPGRATRPTSDRVREAVFSMVESAMADRLNGLEGATVWDLFAGSGAMGIEALSRGAAHATFVDQAGQALSAVRTNLAALGYGPQRASVVGADVLRWASGAPGAPGAPGGVEADLVVADPPYAWQGWAELLACLAPLGPLVLAETGGELALPPGWRSLRAKRYGGTVVTLARFSEGS